MCSLMIYCMFASTSSWPSITKSRQANFYNAFNFFHPHQEKTQLYFRSGAAEYPLRYVSKNSYSSMSNEASNSIHSNHSKAFDFFSFPVHSYFSYVLQGLSTSKIVIDHVSISDLFFFTNSSSFFNTFNQRFAKGFLQYGIIICIFVFSIFVFFAKKKSDHMKSNFHKIIRNKNHKSDAYPFMLVLFFAHCFQEFDGETLTLNPTEYTQDLSEYQSVAKHVIIGYGIYVINESSFASTASCLC